MKREMFYKADPLVFGNARELRTKLTPAEQTFWLRLKEQFPEYKFRRQHPISIYIADFYCHEIKLVIEVDGSIHSVKEVMEHDVIKEEHTMEIYKNISSAYLWILPNSGHSTPVVYANEFNSKVDAFFKQPYRRIDREKRFF